MNISDLPLMRFMKGKMIEYTPGMVTCLEFEEYIDRYLDNTLAPKEAKVFNRHIKICKACGEYLASYQRTITQGKAVFSEEILDDAVPDAVPSGLVEAIQQVKLQK